MTAMKADLGDIRLAFNAIAAVDGLAAQIYWWAFHNSSQHVAGMVDDTDYRGRLAKQDNDFRLLFETAKAVKHGRLTRGSPSVRAADQVVASITGWDNFRWDDARWDINQVRIEPIGETPWTLEGVLDRALAFLERQMATLGIP
ncbi:MAG TPA: hypothetical protein VFB13_17650 [Reyranella sp.]|nr:hypothetical protein [Reyranella sp.]